MNQRDQRMRSFLERQGLGALILTRPDEMVMATGYQPHWNASVALYPSEGPPVVYAPAHEPSFAVPDPVEVKRYGGEGEPTGQLLDLIKGKLRDRSVGQQPVGVVPHASQSAPARNAAEGSSLPARFLDRLAEAVDSDTRDVSDAVLELYVHKTADEVDAIRLANTVADHGLRAFYDNLTAGRSEAEVASAVEGAIQNRTGRNGVRFARAWAMVQSGEEATHGGTFNRVTGRRLAEGDMVMIELATCVNGYWSDLTRTGAVGELGETQAAAYQAVRNAQRAAIAKVEPGERCAEVHQAARDVLEQHGLGELMPHPTGHHTGFRYHDPGPALVPGETASLEPGMIITVEPGVYGESIGAGTRTEDNVLVTEDAHEILSNAPRSLHGQLENSRD